MFENKTKWDEESCDWFNISTVCWGVPNVNSFTFWYSVWLVLGEVQDYKHILFIIILISV